MLRNTLLIGFIFFAARSYSQTKNDSAVVNHEISNQVYVCMGNTAKAYHKTDTCLGVMKCGKNIVPVVKEKAVIEYHRKPCKLCYSNIR